MYFPETPVACVSCTLILSIAPQQHYHHEMLYLVSFSENGERDCLWEIDWIIGVGCWERWLFWSAICVLFSMKSLPSKESILLRLLLLLVFCDNRMISELIRVLHQQKLILSIFLYLIFIYSIAVMELYIKLFGYLYINHVTKSRFDLKLCLDR